MRPLLLGLFACHHPDELPTDFAIGIEGLDVAVSADPYAITVSADGVQLASADDGDGWAAAAPGEGITSWTPVVTPGYHDFEAIVSGWDADHVLIDALSDDDSVELVFDDGVHLLHTVRPGALRVEGWVDGPAPRFWEVAFASAADEGFVGFGERFDATDHRGHSVPGWAEEGGVGAGEGVAPGPDNPWPNGQDMTYFPVPFFVSTAGYAFWLDTEWRHDFELAPEAHPQAWRATHIGPALAYEVYVPLPGDSRPWPLQELDTFTAATGRPMTPPDWAFGPRRRIGSVAELQAMREADLALTGADDALHVLPAGSHVGRQDERRAWTTAANALGVKVCAYLNAMWDTRSDSPLADEVQAGIDAGYFLKKPDGSPSTVFLVSGTPVTVVTTDYTNPDAVRFWQRAVTWTVDMGYSGVMLDFGEYVQPDDVAFDGRTGEQYHGPFATDYDRAAHDAFEAELPGDWLYFSRSGYTGSSRYAPFVWSGDPAASFDEADGLPSIPRAAINAGASGIPHWGGDTGGFHCVGDGAEAADGELLTRWIEVAALMSNLQDQDACVGDPGGEKASIWTSPDAFAAWKTYARLHTRLQPYFLKLAADASATGAPVVRSLFLEFPSDPSLAAVDDAWLVGDAMLAAPVVERGARSRSLTLPPGEWLDWRNGSVLTGTVALDVPLDSLPIFLRDGRLVPMLDPTIDTLAPEADPDIVSPADVDDVYDVVGFLTPTAGGASTVLVDGTSLQVSWVGGLANPQGLVEAASESDLATCDGCFQIESVGDATRVRVSTTSGEVLAGGLQLRSIGLRRTRWDVWLAE